VQRYSSNRLPEESLLQCLYSISDNNSFLLFNRDPVDRMIAYLQHYFQPNQVEQGFSLGISGGFEGARLTHNHQRQYNYALQSLTLWREISHDMFKLWCLAETDLLSESNSYRLTNTGQVSHPANCFCTVISLPLRLLLHGCWWLYICNTTYPLLLPSLRLMTSSLVYCHCCSYQLQG